MARKTRGRVVNGIVLLEKATGMTSNSALQQVKRIFFAQKAGHTGALDPLATGMLPICLGEATKFSQYLLESDKRYQVTAKLGVRTTTSDADGEVVSTRPVAVTLKNIEQSIGQFLGSIEQSPSMFSALKHEGKPLYWYARQGIEVPRKTRTITVHSIDILSFAEDELRLDIHCSKGTYIRTIVDDLGEILGCGAHVAQLHRSHVGDYPSDQVVSLEVLRALAEQATDNACEPASVLDPLLLPMDSAVAVLPAIDVDEASGDLLRHGQRIRCPQAPTGTHIRIYMGQAHQFIGLGEVNDEGLLCPKRLVVLDA